MVMREVSPINIFHNDNDRIDFLGDMYRSAAIPSLAHSYSIGIEYIRDWFLHKFNDNNTNYFKSVYIDGKHIAQDFKKFSINEKLKLEKPNVAIVPEIELEYDREKLDLYENGLDSLYRRSYLESSFFRDFQRNLFLGMRMEALKINFEIKVRVNSKAEQLDLYKYMQIAFKVGISQNERIDIDYHIPYSLMIQIAKDAGFRVENNKIVNIGCFIRYINSHSYFPIMFKYRAITGNYEFFMKLRDQYMRIECPSSISADSGEREGMTYSNFVLSLNVELLMPSIQVMQYYSTRKHDNIRTIESDKESNFIGLNSIKIPRIPDVNDKGWNKILTTEWVEDELDKPLKIEFEELISGSDVEKVINYNKSMYLSPSNFIEFKLYNDGHYIDSAINWDTLTLFTKVKPKSMKTAIAVYVNLGYVNDQIIQMEDMEKDRLEKKAKI